MYLCELNANFCHVIARPCTGPGVYRVARAVFSGVNPATIAPINLSPCLKLSNIINVTITSCAPSLYVEPNPTNRLSNVTFVVNDEMYHTLEVYDMQGRLLSTLLNERASAGQEYRFTFDGSALPNGVYLYRLSTGESVTTEKFIIVR